MIFVPSGIITHIFTACSTSTLELVMITFLGSLTTFPCQEKDVADISLSRRLCLRNLDPLRYDGNRLMLASVLAWTPPPLTVTSKTISLRP